MPDYIVTLLYLLGIIVLFLAGVIYIHNRDQKRDAKKIKEGIKRQDTARN